jgi:uncharacterized membrane protein YeaQ/YmgE (transglycosylase-associated protein family)
VPNDDLDERAGEKPGTADAPAQPPAEHVADAGGGGNREPPPPENRTTEGHQTTQAPRRAGFLGVARFILTVLVIVVLQYIFQLLVFHRIEDDSSFREEIVQALEQLRPEEIVKLWLESFSSYREPIADTPEYQFCAKTRRDTKGCADDAQAQRAYVIVPDEQQPNISVAPRDPATQTSLKAIIGTGYVLTYPYVKATTDGQRLVAILQLALGFTVSFFVTRQIYRRNRTGTPDDWRYAMLYCLLGLVGAFVATTLLAWPVRLAGLVLFAFIPGIYAAVMIKIIEKAVDALMHQTFERRLGGGHDA